MQLGLNGRKAENKKKNGKPMINFEHNMKDLFEFLKFTNALNKHWMYLNRWGMIRTMNNVILK
jgi:hypothetical protein